MSTARRLLLRLQSMYSASARSIVNESREDSMPKHNSSTGAHVSRMNALASAGRPSSSSVDGCAHSRGIERRMLAL
eukprot:5911169-Prymnesium_polylepis.1